MRLCVYRAAKLLWVYKNVFFFSLSVDFFNLMQPDYQNNSKCFTWTNTQSEKVFACESCKFCTGLTSSAIQFKHVSHVSYSRCRNAFFFCLSLKSVNLSAVFDVNRKCNSGKYEAEKPLKRGIDVHFVQTLLNSLEKHKVSGTWNINRLLYMLIFCFYLKAHFTVWLIQL